MIENPTSSGGPSPGTVAPVQMPAAAAPAAKQSDKGGPAPRTFEEVQAAEKARLEKERIDAGAVDQGGALAAKTAC
jgi:hypothetical protein